MAGEGYKKLYFEPPPPFRPPPFGLPPFGPHPSGAHFFWFWAPTLWTPRQNWHKVWFRRPLPAKKKTGHRRPKKKKKQKNKGTGDQKEKKKNPAKKIRKKKKKKNQKKKSSMSTSGGKGWPNFGRRFKSDGVDNRRREEGTKVKPWKVTLQDLRRETLEAPWRWAWRVP